MNILFITHYSNLYGANRSLVNLLDGLKKYNINALVVIPDDGDICNVLEKIKVPFILQNFHWWCGEKNHVFFNRKNSLRNFIKKHREIRLRKKENYNYLTELHNKINNFQPDFICSNSSVFNFGFLYSRKINKPHIWFLRESQEQYNLNWFYNIKEVNGQFKRSEIVISVSNFLKKYYHNKNNINNIKVLYNGVLSQKELVSLDTLKRRKRDQNLVVFGLVGLIHPMKGQSEAIEAFSILQRNFPESKLLIVGSGHLEPLKKLVEKLNLNECVEFWGQVSDPFEAFLAMDVSLMCSRMEGLGRVTLEAMATGLPVIGYEEGGTKEIIINGKNGLLYKNGVEDLADKMEYLVKNKNEILRLGQNGRKDFERKYTSEVYGKKFYQIIENYNLSHNK